MSKFCYSLLALALLQVSAQAQISGDDEFDFFVGRPEVGSQTVTGGINVTQGDQLFPGLRAIGAEFGPALSGDGFNADEPGFNNPGLGGDQVPGALALEPGDLLTITQIDVDLDGIGVGPLFFWDGLGDVNFVPATGVTFEIEQPEDAAGPLGAFDDHPILSLTNDAGGSPAEGIYLASFTATLDGFDPSLPLFVAIGSPGSTEEQLAAAVSFVQEIVPEPTSVMLACVVLPLFAVRRR